MPTRLDLDRLEEELVALAATDAAAAMAAYKAHYTSMAAAYVREYEARPAGVFVLTVGAQPDSVTLSLLATPAQNVYFLHTDESGGNADRAAEVAGLTAQVHKRHVGKVDPLSIYQTVSQILSAHPGADVLLDMTSGAKSMTAALAAAGYLQGPDARLVLRYVDSDSVKGMFFYCRVLDLEHPVVGLGEHERRAAVSAYAAGRYTQSADFFPP